MDRNKRTKEDLELIKLAKKGDELAKNTLINKYERLAYWSLPESARWDEDEKQWALYDAWRAILWCDESFNANSLAPLIIKFVKNSFLNRLKYQNAKKRKPQGIESLFKLLYGENSSKSLIDTINPELLPDYFGEDITDLSNKIENEENIHKLIELIQRTNLSKKCREVLSLHLQGFRNYEIADALNINLNNLRQMIFFGINRIRERFELEEKATIYIQGNIFQCRYPKDGKLKLQRVIFQQLLEQKGLTPERFPTSLLHKYNLYLKRDIKNCPPRKAEIINRLLLPEQRLPDFLFYKGEKWTNSRKKNVFNAMEYMVMEGIYVLKKNTRERFSFATNIRYVLGGTTKANLDFQKERLGLNDIELNKYQILAKISDNNSNIFNGDYQIACDKVRDHLKTLDEIISETNLTKRQRKVFDLWVQGKKWDEIIVSLPNEFEKSNDKVKIAWNEINLAEHKFRVTAIKKYTDQFEKEVNLETLEKETLAIYNSGNLMNIHDRYYRLRLGILIKKIAKEKNLNFKRLPYLTTHKNFQRLNTDLIIFDGSTYEMLEFSFPGLFPDWMFCFKGKWHGTKGRERSFHAIDYVLRKKNKFLFEKKEAREYHLGGMMGSLWQRGTFSKPNKYYVEEYLKNQLNINNKQFEKYVANRKLLAILFDTKGSPIKKKFKINDEQILSLDRPKLYQIANFSPKQQQEWEYRIELWKYYFKYFNHKEVGQKIERSARTVNQNFLETRKKLAEAVEITYSK